MFGFFTLIRIIPSFFSFRPIKFSEAIKDFEKGQFCYVVARRFQGKGSVKLILYESSPVGTSWFDTLLEEPCGPYVYGKTWVVLPGTLSGMCRSDKKAASSRKNGIKGGRPAK